MSKAKEILDTLRVILGVNLPEVETLDENEVELAAEVVVEEEIAETVEKTETVEEELAEDVVAEEVIEEEVKEEEVVEEEAPEVDVKALEERVSQLEEVIALLVGEKETEMEAKDAKIEELSAEPIAAPVVLETKSVTAPKSHYERMAEKLYK